MGVAPCVAIFRGNPTLVIDRQLLFLELKLHAMNEELEQGAAIFRNPEALLDYISTWKKICIEGIAYYNERHTADPRLTEIADMQLLNIDYALVSALYANGTDAADDFAALYSTFTKTLLYTNRYIDVNDPQEKSGSGLILSELEAQFELLAKYPGCETLIAAKRNFLKDHKFILKKKADKDAFTRYHLRAKLLFLSGLEAVIWQNPERLDDISALEYYTELVDRNFDIDLAALQAPKMEYESEEDTALLPSGGFSEAQTDYTEIKKRIATINDEIGTQSALILKEKDPKSQDAAFDAYKDLAAKREIYTTLLSQKEKQLSYVDGAKVYVEKNLKNSKAAAESAGKVILATAGLRLTKAVFNSLSGKGDKNDWGEIGTALAYDLAEATATGIATLVLGPVGAKLAGQLIGFMRPQKVQIDPNVKRFKELNDKIDSRFDALGLKIADLEKKIETQMEDWAVYIIHMQEKKSVVSQLKLAMSDTKASIKKLDDMHREIFTQQREVDIKAVLDLNDKIEEGIRRLFSLFYNQSIHEHDSAAYPPVDGSSVAGIIIGIYKSQGKSNVDFMKAVEELSNMCDWIQQLVESYLKAYPKLYTIISAVFAFQNTSNTPYSNKEKLFDLLYDFLRKENDLKAELFAVSFVLKKLVVGESNLNLYNNVSTYWQKPEKFNFLNGFGLSSGNQQLALRFESEDFTGNSWFSLSAEKDYFFRYYLLPVTGKLKGYTSYKLVTNQENEIPVETDVVINLDFNDTLQLLSPASGKRLSAASVSLLSGQFAGSLEQQLLEGREIDVSKPVSWSLPLRAVTLKTSADEGLKLLYETKNRTHNNNVLWHEKTQPGDVLRSLRLALNDGYVVMTLTLQRAGKPVTQTTDVMACSDRIVLSAETHQAFYKLKNGERVHNIQMYDAQNTIFPGAVLRPQDCQVWSLNGEYHLQFDKSRRYDPVLNLYKGDELIGSVFSRYTYKNNYNVYVTMQEDGNFVMYDTNRHAVAAINSGELSNLFLHLTNNGKLFLLSENKSRAAEQIHVRKQPEFVYDKNGRIFSDNQFINRLFSGQRLYLDQYLVSENGRFFVKMSIEGMQKGGLFSSDTNLYSLIIYEDHGPVHKVLNQGAYTHKRENLEGVYTEMKTNGNVAMYYIKRDMLGGINHNPLPDLGTGGNPGAFLEITNDGALNLISEDGKRVIKQIHKL